LVTRTRKSIWSSSLVVASNIRSKGFYRQE
jgi:hypothetical protein